jgi:hypothetical protein
MNQSRTMSLTVTDITISKVSYTLYHANSHKEYAYVRPIGCLFDVAALNVGDSYIVKSETRYDPQIKSYRHYWVSAIQIDSPHRSKSLLNKVASTMNTDNTFNDLFE